ncbi:polymeric immunoglobulin receptor-like [Trichomycterus rosablanca]|uniref:polymeric immunoglobulin receptor-like n=1 Tax=Trichomycterus rosablanca TaxID=2290929 RepID=UPI002F353034
MKILLIFVLYLISGPADGSNVTGYSGGSVIICSDQKWDSMNSKYICKTGQPGCTDVIRSYSKSNKVQSGRFMLYNRVGTVFGVLIRRLKPQDAGTYRIGTENQNSYDTVNLKVINDFCCGGSKTMNAYLGESITLTCKYPEEYETYYKDITKFNDDANIEDVINTKTSSQNGRFSIFDNKSAKVISVKISNVTDNDEGYYLCGVWKGEGSVRYFTFFTEIQLKVTAKPSTTIQPTTAYRTTSTTPKATSSDQACYTKASFVVTIVSVIVALLLIGGFAMIFYKLRCTKTQGSMLPMMYHHKNVGDEDNNPANLYENFRKN